jgi:hypothetical protein
MAHDDRDTTTDERRAEWERFTMTVCENGVVNVRNDSHGDDAGDHIHSVRVADKSAVGCSCPHATYRGAHCKHQIAVENRPLIVSSADAASAQTPPVAADGGTSDHRKGAA